MGLDNGFILKSTKDENLKLELAYFRKFFELDTFIRSTAKAKPDDEDVFEITVEVLKTLKEELYPTVKTLIQIPERLLWKYDEAGDYPKKYKLTSAELAHDDFNPVYSTSWMAGVKAMKLYHAVEVMIDILQDDDYQNMPEFSKGYYIEFYSSY